MKRNEKKDVLGMLGIILTIGGAIATIPLGINKSYVGVSISGLSLVIGLLLISYGFST